MNEKDPHRYDDIIDLPRFVSRNRKHMSNYDRAAQFAPFDALEGFDEEMDETARTTQDEVALGENEIELLNRKFQIVYEHLKELGEVSVTYFEPDLYKEGGAYLTKTVMIKRIDMANRVIISSDNERFNLDYITDIDNEFISKCLEQGDL